MSGRKLTPTDKRAWHAVTRRGVTRYPEADEADTDFENAMKSAESSEIRNRVMKLSSPMRLPKDTGHLKAPRPADRGREKRIRRGQAPINARLDLHGHTQTSGLSALMGFVTQQRHSGARCVLVITGKGRSGEGVLRRRFIDWLETPAARQHVSGFAVAHQKHGGEGAFYVFLRRLSPAE